LTDHSYAATLSQICSEARAKILAENPDVTFNNPNLLLPAHKNKQVRKRQRNQDKENNVTQQDSSSSTQSGEYYQHPLTQLTIPSYQAQTLNPFYYVPQNLEFIQQQHQQLQNPTIIQQQPQLQQLNRQQQHQQKQFSNSSVNITHDHQTAADFNRNHIIINNDDDTCDGPPKKQ